MASQSHSVSCLAGSCGRLIKCLVGGGKRCCLTHSLFVEFLVVAEGHRSVNRNRGAKLAWAEVPLGLGEQRGAKKLNGTALGWVLRSKEQTKLPPESLYRDYG